MAQVHRPSLAPAAMAHSGCHVGVHNVGAEDIGNIEIASAGPQAGAEGALDVLIIARPVYIGSRNLAPLVAARGDLHRVWRAARHHKTCPSYLSRDDGEANVL